MTVPAVAGERFERQVRLDEAAIRSFACTVDDLNPIHHDAAVARAAGFPGLIASGTHVGSLLMAMTATHFSRPLADGTPRAPLGLGFELAFKGPVVADDQLALHWVVESVERKASLRGWITRLSGEARSATRGVVIAGTGTVLLRLGAECTSAERS